MIPEVSIVMPTYNRRHTLYRAIKSLVSQTYVDWEIIIVDDGSTDGTEDFCQKYKQRLGDRFQYFLQENLGASAARNKGLELARGRWVSFMDSDDVQMPEKLSHQLGKMNNLDCGFSFTGFYFFTDDLDIIAQPVAIPPEFEGNIYPGILETRYNVVMTPSVVVDRKLVISVGGFDTSMAVCEDIDLWGRVCQHTRATSVNLPHIGVHLLHPKNFPYMEGMRGRFQLYERAVRRDSGALQISQSSIISMYEMYCHAASVRGDEDAERVLNRGYDAIKNGENHFKVMENTVAELCSVAQL